MRSETLYDLWLKANPKWEIRYEDSIIKKFCEYGRGATSAREYRGAIFGGGYEIYIVAFFLGLYHNQRRKLNPDSTKIKAFGHIVQYWGNVDTRDRTPYPKLREYIFMALIARTEVDFIALEKGQLSARKVVEELTKTMEEYANWGFHYMEDKLLDNPDYYSNSETVFLEEFLKFEVQDEEGPDDMPEPLDEEPESLDSEREVPMHRKRPRIGQRIEPRKKDEDTE